MSDLRNCCSDEELSTGPWCFFSSSSIFLFLSVSFKKAKQSRKKVSMNLCFRHTKIAGCTCDIISNAPAINTINRSDAGFACTLLHPELHRQTYVLKI